MLCIGSEEVAQSDPTHWLSNLIRIQGSNKNLIWLKITQSDPNVGNPNPKWRESPRNVLIPNIRFHDRISPFRFIMQCTNAVKVHIKAVLWTRKSESDPTRIRSGFTDGASDFGCSMFGFGNNASDFGRIPYSCWIRPKSNNLTHLIPVTWTI